ncbi:class I SAM-dependent methyltransferase [Bradyrhizobium sediminis]|uniref:Class I SAM-dependent methyltransferase n=1 Tax=Bradyrhizobium sediminis TaxID=2840469 RepID=A0A975P108_9BRAD|nr:class I SAM-dependent methyltransferase [Bradyrhizobium sediminis]QWG25098.1 class I SAM-dependent methyltransferase [Bradyrhizobium sediminis]
MTSQLPAFLENEAPGLVAYLTRLYQGTFTAEAIRTHLDAHVGYGFADYAVAVSAPHLPAAAKVLDLGCGFGSYVLRAREAGLDAVGIELAAFEIEFARARLRRLRPQDDADKVFRVGDATELGFVPGSFDAVTLWNVLEHIDDAAALLRSVDRLLKPGGQIFIVCPNYDATRDEAHYHVPWNADLSRDRGKAVDYLRSLGRDPAFFETSIYCRSNREVIGILENLGYAVFELSPRRPISCRLRYLVTILRQWKAVQNARSNLKHSVEIAAVKAGR